MCADKVMRLQSKKTDVAGSYFTGPSSSVTETVKCSAEVCYPMKLDLAKYCTAGCAASGTAYVLSAVLLHTDDSLHEGHYKCLHHVKDGSWWLRNDDHMPTLQTQLQALMHHREVCGLLYSRDSFR